MARPDAVSPACYPHSLDLRFMQFSLYLGLRAPHVQLCSRTMNSSGRVVSTRAFSNSKTGLFRLRELVEVFTRINRAERTARIAVQQHLCVRNDQLYQVRPFPSQQPNLGLYFKEFLKGEFLA